eukprot:GHVT01035535.1.p2 GENE.GHVT01035535.1~~GHVT01035535.1.p2  ORF type:complete len:502 (+),score=137.85 GHVT01035535.1:2174-3679(+)
MEASSWKVEENELKQAQAAEEERAAAALAEEHGRKVQEAAERRRICEGSEELRELRQKLQEASVSRERSLQLLEVQIRSEEEAAREAALERHAEVLRLQAENDKVRKEKMSQEERVKMAHEISQQMEAARLEEAARRHKEAAREKQLVEEIVSSIREEDREERSRRQEARMVQRRDLEEFLQHRTQLLKAQKRQEDEEEQKIAEFAALQLAREAERERVRKEQQEARKQMLSELSRKHAEHSTEKEEMERLLNELYMAEKEELERQREEEAIRKRASDRDELRQAYERQRALQLEKRREEEQEEARLQQVVHDKFLQDEQQDQLKAEERKQMTLKHMQEAARLAEARRAAKETKIEEEQLEQQAGQRAELYRLRVIEEERQRLLRAHGGNLAGFLAKGTLKDSKELDIVREAAALPPRLARQAGAFPASQTKESQAVTAQSQVAGGRRSSGSSLLARESELTEVAGGPAPSRATHGTNRQPAAAGARVARSGTHERIYGPS